MANYLVYRIGSNAANQGITQRMPVAIVEAPSRKAALEKAEDQINCYNNQSLELVAESRARTADWNQVLENEALSGVGP